MEASPFLAGDNKAAYHIAKQVRACQITCIAIKITSFKVTFSADDWYS